MNLFILLVVGIASALAADISPGHICHFGQHEFQTLLGLMDSRDGPRTFTNRLQHCRFAPGNEWVEWAIKTSILQHDRALFQFFLERVNFEPGSRDRAILGYMAEALRYTEMAIFEYLWLQPFPIISRSEILASLSSYNFDKFKELLQLRPDRAVEIAPHPEDIINTDMRGANRIELLIELARVCSHIHKPHSVAFNPSEWLLALVRNRSIPDASMVVFIKRLCDLGALVDDEVFQVLASVNRNHPRSVNALHEQVELQNLIKEPDVV